MRIELSVNIDELRDTAESLLKRRAARMVGEAAARMQAIYAAKLDQARRVLNGEDLPDGSLLLVEAASRGWPVETLALAVVAAAKEEEVRLAAIEKERLNMKNTIRSGTAQEIRDLIIELEREESDRARGLYIVGGRVTNRV